MKKIKVLLSALAILTAGFGVFANNSLDITYYSSETAGANCDDPIELPQVCDGAGPQCSIEDMSGTIYISVSPSGDPEGEEDCVELPKAL